MSISVRPVRGARELRAFVELPFRLNADEVMWTPPLTSDFELTLSKKNPVFQDGRGERELFVAWRDGKAVGRVLAHVHHASNTLHGEKAGLFGYLECGGDDQLAQALLDETSRWHRERGLATQRGPYELNVSQCIGAVVSGFDEPASFSQSWHPPYVAALLERLGFSKLISVSTFRIDDLASCRPDAWLGDKQRRWLADPKVRVRGWDMERFDEDMRAATSLLNESFATNWGFVPLSEPEVAFISKPMKRVVRPELTVFMEYDGVPVGVGMALPDFNVLFRRMNGRLLPFGWAQFLLGGRSLDVAVVQFVATTPKLQNQGLMRVVLADLVTRLQRAGFRSLEATWISEQNAKSRASALAVGMREKHRLQVYERSLSSI